MLVSSRVAITAALLWGAAAPVALPTAACAGQSARAALVVDAGDDGGTFRYCVQLSEPSVSGIELIRLAGEQYGLDYELDSGGQAVCMLAGVGAPGDDCFGKYPDFWGYWRGGDGGWSWSSTGGGSTVVEDGDVEGWAWGSGQDGSSHPRPPETPFSSVCAAVAARSREQPTNDERGEPARKGSRARTVPAAAAEEQAPTTPARPPGQERRRAGKAPAAAARPSPDAETSVAAVAADAPADGPPVAGFLSLGLFALLAGAGALVMRRRQS